MNVRKAVDYNAMFKALDTLVAKALPQMELYYEVGCLVGNRLEKGAAVAAAGYLQVSYPDATGFSPRNLRRMRDFYRMYRETPEILAEAITLGWTQNVVILEADLALQERMWYIRAAQKFGWSKLELQRKIKERVHLESALDLGHNVCYTEENHTDMERKNNDKDTFCVPREYMPEPDGRVCDEGPGEKSRAGGPVPHRVRCHQYRGDRQSGLSSGPPQAGRAWYRLRWQNGPSVKEQGLRSVRPADRDGQGQSAKYASDLRRRFRWQDSLAYGVCGPPG